MGGRKAGVVDWRRANSRRGLHTDHFCGRFCWRYFGKCGLHARTKPRASRALRTVPEKHSLGPSDVFIRGPRNSTVCANAPRSRPRPPPAFPISFGAQSAGVVNTPGRLRDPRWSTRIVRKTCILEGGVAKVMPQKWYQSGYQKMQNTVFYNQNGFHGRPGWAGAPGTAANTFGNK